MDRKRYRLWNKEEGATSVEYALIASSVAGVIALAVSVLGGLVLKMFQAAVGMFP